MHLLLAPRTLNSQPQPLDRYAGVAYCIFFSLIAHSAFNMYFSFYAVGGMGVMGNTSLISLTVLKMIAVEVTTPLRTDSLNVHRLPPRSHFDISAMPNHPTFHIFSLPSWMLNMPPQVMPVMWACVTVHNDAATAERVEPDSMMHDLASGGGACHDEDPPTPPSSAYQIE